MFVSWKHDTHTTLPDSNTTVLDTQVQLSCIVKPRRQIK
jgi:hypothetical protein